MLKCEIFCDQMVACIQNDLPPLESERLKSHLAHCNGCDQLYHQLQTSLQRAQQWNPVLAREERKTLNVRLTPYLSGPDTRPKPWFFVSVAAAVVLLCFAGVRFFANHRSALVPQSAVSVINPLDESVPTDAKTFAPPINRSQPLPQLRMVTSNDWDGRMVKTESAASLDSKETQIVMTRGYGVFSFIGGQGRSLHVEAANVRIEVIGTQLSVEIDPLHNGTVVGVQHGRVRVDYTGAGGRPMHDFIGGGEQRRYRAGEPSMEATVVPQSRVVWQDRFLLEHRQLVHLENAEPRQPPGRSSLEKPRSEPSPANPAAGSARVPPQLTLAERQSATGNFVAAVAAYQSILQANSPDMLAYHPLARYEIARLQGFHLKQEPAARLTLIALAAEYKNEVGRQAAISLCELDLASNPCSATACLKNISEGQSDKELAAEAQKLFQRWNLEKNNCGLKK